MMIKDNPILPGMLVELDARENNEELNWNGYLQYVCLSKREQDGSYRSTIRRDYYDEDPPLLYLGCETVKTPYSERREHMLLWDDGVYILFDGVVKFRKVFRKATGVKSFAQLPGGHQR